MRYAARTSATSATPHLLIIDDNHLGLQARKAVMEELGYRVTTVGAPAEALDRLGKEIFDIVITDYRLPAMNGADFIERMRGLEIQTPVILISGFVDALGLDEKNTGADLVIQKSANEVSHMIRGVKSILKRASQKKPPGSQGGSPKSTRRKA